MSLLSLSDVKGYARRTYGVRMAYKSAASILRDEMPAVPLDAKFDVFLSHSYADAQLDAEAMLGLVQILRKHGVSVYVDWIVDRDLDRANVTPRTASLLRVRMLNSKCLFFASSTNSTSSKWMPWELGYKDGQSGRVGILPLTGGTTFRGQEYLGLYPYVDFVGSSIFINSAAGTWVRFEEWLRGKNPAPQ